MMSLKNSFGDKKPPDFNQGVTERLRLKPFEWFLSGSSHPKFKHLACLGEIQLDSIPAAVDIDKESEIQAFRKGVTFLQEAEGGCWNASGYRPPSNKTDILTQVMKRFSLPG